MGLASRYYSYYDYYEHQSPWDREVTLDYNYFANVNFFFAEVAFECLVLLALVSFSIWCCTLRNAITPLRVAIAALTFWMSAQTITVIIDILWCAVVEVKEYYNIANILQIIFELIAYCVVFITFYTIIHKLFDRLTDSGRPYRPLSGFHWAVAAVVTILSIADFGISTAVIVKNVELESAWTLQDNLNKLTSARAIIYFLASLEIVACAIFIVVKGQHRFHSKTPLYSLLVGTISWFGYNLMNVIIQIRYYLKESFYDYYPIPNYLPLVRDIFEFVFVIGLFSGILMCIMYWHKVEEQKNVEMPISSVQQPYGTGPVQYPQVQQPYGAGPVHYPPHVEQHYQA